jgi:predicted PurR-regulated permease PerM
MMKAARNGRRISSGALMIIATTCVIGTLYLAKPVVVPLLLAIVFALCLGPAVDGLVRLRAPRALAAAVVLVGVLIAISMVLNATWSPAREWLDSAPQTMATIEAKVRPVQLLIGKLDRIGQSARHLASAYQAHGQVPATDETKQVALSIEAITIVPAVIATAAMVVGLVYLLLAFGPEWMRRLQLAHSADMARSSVVLTRAIRLQLSRYLASIALINIGVGLAVALLSRLCGLPNPLLWGTLAALLNFVPYFGPFCMLVILSAVGLVNLATLPQVLLLGAGFLMVTFFEGQIIQPLVLGRRLQLNPIAVLLGMWLLWALWGVAGVVLAVPLLLTANVLAAHIKPMRSLHPLIGALPVCSSEPAAADRAPAVSARKLSLAP